MSEALEKCPNAVVVEPRMSLYAEVSREIMEILGNYTPLVEKLSLDEAFLDMSGSQKLFGEPPEMAAQIRADIQEETDLTASVGIAKNKFLAKLASDLDKPDGVTEVPRGSERDYIAPMDVGKIWGVGPKAKQRLNALGLETVGDVAEADEVWLREELGNFAGHIQSLARGEDERPVVADSEQKSVGSEGTMRENIQGAAAVADQLRGHCQTVARELRKKELKARGVRVKVRYDDTFSLATRQVKLPTAADDSKTLLETAKTRLSELDLSRPIRLVGAAAYDLVDADEAVQADLFASSTAEQESELEHTLDAIREKFGDKIGRGDG
jgi:DNA polymerase-4